MTTHPHGPPGRILVIGNPNAGGKRGRKAAYELEALLRAEGFEVDCRITGDAGDALRWCAELSSQADQPPFDVVASVGGDGTLREILDGLSRANIHLPVAMLPLGTANVLALDFKLLTKPAGVVATILGGHTRMLDLGEVRSRNPATGEQRRMTSFLAVGVGLDANVVEALHLARAERSGGISKLSYIPHIAHALLFHRPPVIKLELDGVPFEGPCGAVLLANVINYGGFLKLDPTSKSDDGMWELYLWRHGTRRELASTALRGILGRLPGGPVERHRVRRATVSSEALASYHVDGDPGGHTPFSFEVTGRRQAICVPTSA